MFLRKEKVKKYISFCLMLGLLSSACSTLKTDSSDKRSNATTAGVPEEKYSAYLFTYFTGNSKAEEAIRFAISNDGYNYRALNNNKPVIKSEDISSTGGVRDPHILRGADGKTFYMVVTDMVSANGWSSNRAMVLLKSNDLVNWTSSVVNIQNRFSGNEDLLRVWAPQTIYDPEAKKYMVYFSMKHGNDPDKIYYAYTNKDFTDLESEPKQLFFSPTNNAAIDGDIIYKDGKYHMFFKTEDAGSGLKVAVSDKLTEGYVLRDKFVQQTKDPVEGSGVFKLNNGEGYILMYDVYTKGKYQFTKTKDLENFEVVDDAISMNFHPRHGTVLPITAKEAEALVSKWGTIDEAALAPQAEAIKKINVVVDTAAKKVYLPVKPGTDVKAFDPDFSAMPGITVSPKGAQNFAAGPVTYNVTIAGKAPQAYQAIVKNDHNPVLAGLYADPDIIYSEKTGKFYIYPTSDGFTGWAGTYFKAFSSPDLVNWKDEGVILDLNKDVSWADRNAWAPCIIEKKVNGAYKYYYYFTAAQKIGVAVADNPTGPFVDSGKPLIDKFPEGVTRGQQIDPDVFTDPKTGKSYLYWGNGYMAAAELNTDMVSLKPGTTKILTPVRSYNEGTHVFYRNGKYYFMWSENDTRDENYQVRYGTSNSPTGKISVPENNLVLVKDTTSGILGTGHHSTIQLPGTDTWYIVYHRFNYPKGAAMGEAAGYNREVSIDKMEFNPDGTIKPVKPTHEGIKPVSLNK
ncbi:family 43 glycosylhydrolase [Pontibacter qinzhouensis]|uniref:Family 43 glycosylhydrolase n=1 Tax=Pontibacter qinzhouensis TaxID=2603253 RepID=A0A5C8K869_9BACT|nr:family 43 glycosylhydrolase [Pontibacter qinzhouensis]TXK49354.1 family 43 glycosylhydrolase [Pontibacter qinzhouensis]